MLLKTTKKEYQAMSRIVVKQMFSTNVLVKVSEHVLQRVIHCQMDSSTTFVSLNAQKDAPNKMNFMSALVIRISSHSFLKVLFVVFPFSDGST